MKLKKYIICFISLLLFVTTGCKNDEKIEQESIFSIDQIEINDQAVAYMDDVVTLLIKDEDTLRKHGTLHFDVKDPSVLEIDENGQMHGLKEGNVEVVVRFINEDETSIESNPCHVSVYKTNPFVKGGFGSIQKTYFQNDYETLLNQDLKQVDRVTEWLNDQVYSEYVLCMLDDIDGLSLESSSFVNESNDVLEHDLMNPNFIKYTLSSPTVGNATFENGVLTPDIIYGNKIDASKDTVLPIFNEWNTSENTKPGIYEGSIYVCKDGYVIKQFKQEIEVLDLIQPSLTSKDSYYLEIWNYINSSSRYYDVPFLSKEHLEILKPHLLEYKKNGGKNVVACIVEEPWNHQIYDDCTSLVKWRKNMDGHYVFDYELFDTYASFIFDEGISDEIECYSILPIASMYTYYDEAQGMDVRVNIPTGSEEWYHAWTSFLTDFTKHLEEKGWYDRISLAMDERQHDEMQTAIDLVKSIPNSKNQTFKLSGAFNTVIDDIWKQMDHTSVNLNYALNYGEDAFKELANTRRQEGKLTTIYTCTLDRPNLYNMYHPSEAYWTIFMAEKMGADGYLRWAYDAWVEDPLEDASFRTFETGDVQMVYPGNRDDKIPMTRFSPRSKRLFEAVRDVEKLRYLKKQSSKMEQEVNALLDGITNYYGQRDMDPLDIEMEELKKSIMDLSRMYIQDAS